MLGNSFLTAGRTLAVRRCGGEHLSKEAMPATRLFSAFKLRKTSRAISKVVLVGSSSCTTYSVLSINSAGVPSEPSAAVFVPSPEPGEESGS